MKLDPFELNDRLLICHFRRWRVFAATFLSFHAGRGPEREARLNVEIIWLLVGRALQEQSPTGLHIDRS